MYLTVLIISIISFLLFDYFDVNTALGEPFNPTLLAGVMGGFITFCAMGFIDKQNEKRWSQDIFYKHKLDKIIQFENALHIIINRLFRVQEDFENPKVSSLSDPRHEINDLKEIIQTVSKCIMVLEDTMLYIKEELSTLKEFNSKKYLETASSLKRLVNIIVDKVNKDTENKYTLEKDGRFLIKLHHEDFEQYKKLLNDTGQSFSLSQSIKKKYKI